VFYPKPNVDSAVVCFEKKENKLKLNDEKLFFELVKNSFEQKRKTLRNNLKGYDLETIEKVLNSFGKDLTYRAENITIEEFANIANELAK